MCVCREESGLCPPHEVICCASRSRVCTRFIETWICAWHRRVCMRGTQACVCTWHGRLCTRDTQACVWTLHPQACVCAWHRRVCVRVTHRLVYSWHGKWCNKLYQYDQRSLLISQLQKIWIMSVILEAKRTTAVLITAQTFVRVVRAWSSERMVETLASFYIFFFLIIACIYVQRQRQIIYVLVFRTSFCCGIIFVYKSSEKKTL